MPPTYARDAAGLTGVGFRGRRAYPGEMDPLQPEEREIERMLEDSRPAPRAAWRAETRRRLLPERPPRRRPLLLGAAAAAALAAGALFAGLIGLEPFAGDDEVEAGRDCRTVTVTRTERVPVVTADERLEYRLQPVTRRVERCD